MDPLAAYKKNSSLETTIASMPRVDVLLSLYDRAIQQLEHAITALRPAHAGSPGRDLEASDIPIAAHG